MGSESGVQALLIVLAVVYGLIIGSFLNAWAWRLAHGEKISAGRSACPHCHHQIRAYDNIPLASWLLLRGRCRDCGAAISWRYPVGEALTAVLFAAVAVYDGPSLILIPHLLFVCVMILVSQVDLETRIIPDVVILPAAVIGVPLMIWVVPGPWWEWPLAGLGAAGFLFLISEVYFRLRHVEGMGFGDVKMALCMGVYLGASVVPALFMGFLSGAVVGVAVVVLRKGNAKTAIPFGPFLAAGAIVAVFVGRSLIDAYLGLVFPNR
jgi:leader peptidase (prepilin peptidase)/N-methyltransferase